MDLFGLIESDLWLEVVSLNFGLILMLFLDVDLSYRPWVVLLCPSTKALSSTDVCLVLPEVSADSF